MELVTFAKEIGQNAAEQVASYKIGQTILRQLDRALWVVEKGARWAVPPPLDQDDRPQPELIRPLPWVFFLMLLIILRVTRESISLINLAMGKPPLRSADVVMYIQGKRRYLRTLKYQGNRIMRARTSTAQPPEGWLSKIQSLFAVTMCFRGRQSHYGNNNTSTNNEELLVVKRSKRPREPSSPTPASETSMERLIEKMMVDLDADSDEDSSYTLTNATTVRSDRSASSGSEDNAFFNETSDTHDEASPIKTDASPTKSDANTAQNNTPKKNTASPNITSRKATSSPNITSTPEKQNTAPEKQNTAPEKQNTASEKQNTAPEKQNTEVVEKPVDGDENQFSSPKKESQMFLDSEKCSRKRTSPKAGDKIGNHVERRDADAPVTKKSDISS